MSRSLKNISVVASATLFSRVLGLLRETLTAAVFGTTALASAYVTAFQLPNLFRRLLAEGGMTAAFVPTFNEELERTKREGAFRFVSQVSSWLLVVSGGLVAVAMLVLSQRGWVEAMGHACGAEPDTLGRWLLAARLAVVLFPYLVFVCLAAVFSAALQSLNRFLEPALSPVWLNLAMIGLLLVGVAFGGTDESKMNWFCGGVLLGGFLQMAVPAWALTREGWRPRFDLERSAAVCAVARLMGPTVLGSAVYLINMTVSRFIGLSVSDAANSVLNYATRFMELPIGVFAIAVTTVVFPLISRHAARGDAEQLGQAYRKGMRLIVIINVPAGIGMAVLAQPIIRLFFQRGAFHSSDTALMVPVLVVYAVGLPFLSFVSLVLRAYYAHKDTHTPVKAALWSFAVNVVLSLVLMGPLSIVGLALAGNIAVLVQAWYLQVRLARRVPQLAVSRVASDLGKIVMASTIMGLVVYGGWLLLSKHMVPSKLGDALSVAVLIFVGVAVYAGVLWKLRVEGRDDVVLLMRRFRGRGPRGSL